MPDASQSPPGAGAPTRSASPADQPCRGVRPRAPGGDLGLVGVAGRRLLRRRPSAGNDPALRRRGPADRVRAAAHRPAALAAGAHRPRRARRPRAVGAALGTLEPGTGHRRRRRSADRRLRARLRARDRGLQPARPADEALAAAARVRGRRSPGWRRSSPCTAPTKPSTCSKPTARSTTRSATATPTRPSSRSPMFPALGLASDRDLDWRLRALALGTATLCIDLLLLSQSRASAPAMAIALVVYALASPYRVRALCWLALAVLPALGILPALTDALPRSRRCRGAPPRARRRDAARRFDGGADDDRGDRARRRCGGRFERRLPGLGSTSARGNRAVAWGSPGWR